MAKKAYFTLIAIGIVLFFCIGQIALSNKFYINAMWDANDTILQYNAMLFGTGILSILLHEIIESYYHREKEKSNLTQKLLSEIPIAFGLQAVTIIIYCICVMAVPAQTETYTNYAESLTLKELPISGILYIVLIAPLFEELLFRGLVIRVMQNACGFWASNVIQAILFAIYHRNLFQGVYTFLFGILLGYVAYKGNNLNCSYFLHMLYNFIGITGFTDYIMQSNTPILGSILIGIFATGIGTIIFIKQSNKEKKSIG